MRRLVSIVYVELDELEGEAGEWDPERLRAMQTSVFDELGLAMERHGGRVERLPGDDAVATFGFDRAHEDDAGRAVRAAAAAASSVARAAVGVASGELIVGDDSILGARVVRTARSLARLAASGEVLIDSGTVDLAPHAADTSRSNRASRLHRPGSGSDPHRMTARPPARSARRHS